MCSLHISNVVRLNRRYRTNFPWRVSDNVNNERSWSEISWRASINRHDAYPTMLARDERQWCFTRCSLIPHVECTSRTCLVFPGAPVRTTFLPHVPHHDNHYDVVSQVYATASVIITAVRWVLPAGDDHDDDETLTLQVRNITCSATRRRMRNKHGAYMYRYLNMRTLAIP